MADTGTTRRALLSAMALAPLALSLAASTPAIGDPKMFAKDWIGRWHNLGNSFSIRDGEIELMIRMADAKHERMTAALRDRLDLPGGRAAVRAAVEQLRPFIGRNWS